MKKLLPNAFAWFDSETEARECREKAVEKFPACEFSDVCSGSSAGVTRYGFFYDQSDFQNKYR